MKRHKSIFFQITMAFLALGLLPLFVAGLVLYAQFMRNMEQVMLEDMSHMVSYTAHNVAELEAECDDLTKMIYDISTEDGEWLWQILKKDSLSPMTRKLRVSEFLKAIQERDSKIRSVVFTDAQGELYYATANTQKVLQAEQFQETMEQANQGAQGAFLLSTHVDDYFPQSKNQVITFSRRYRDVSEIRLLDQTLGTVYVDLDLEKISSVIQEQDLKRESTICLVSAFGDCIYSTNPLEREQGISNWEEIEGLLRGVQGSVRTAKEYLVYQEIPKCGWKILMRIPRSALMRNLDQTRQVVVIFVIGSFCILMFLYESLLRRFREPVKKLEAGMNEIQKGNFSARVDVEREDEIGVLAKGLNQMAEELEAYIHRVYVAEIRQREAELDALKSQIKPHYLYNTLDVIRMMALEHDDEQTAGMVESLSRQLKYLIGYNSDLVPLSRELDNIREYFRIMKVRYENRICLEIDVEDQIAECSIIKLSLQPIVENAVKHGLRPKKGEGSVRIEAFVDEDLLEITVMDDGVGMSEETLEKLQNALESDEIGEKQEDGWHHVGLKNAYDRIKKNFGEEYGLEIMSSEGIGTVVTMHLPVIREKQGEFQAMVREEERRKQ
ncbi:cache domain-containing sensor histidine kinase [Brotaphodocola sp.]|uniref:cache domain-containing sensor histidine kinase n=1 Tax=Brotaphodocola sp. TaxID=3073577 RepID=UPI003D7D9E28